jgi:hypothetical protein
MYYGSTNPLVSHKLASVKPGQILSATLSLQIYPGFGDFFARFQDFEEI